MTNEQLAEAVEVIRKKIASGKKLTPQEERIAAFTIYRAGCPNCR